MRPELQMSGWKAYKLERGVSDSNGSGIRVPHIMDQIPFNHLEDC